MEKIPAHATRVFKGVIFDVYQWQQKMYDGTETTFEMAKRPDTVVVIPLADGKVFYSRQQQPNRQEPFYGLFGGRAEEGEEPLVAAKRELLEEAGLESDDWQPFMHWKAPSKLEWNVHYFLARDCRKVANQNLDAGEKIEILSCTPEKFVKEIMTADAFYETELKSEIFSALDSTKANELIARFL